MTECEATRSLRNAGQCHGHLHSALHRSLVQLVLAQFRSTDVAIETGRVENPLPFPRSIGTGNLPGERTRKGYRPGSAGQVALVQSPHPDKVCAQGLVKSRRKHRRAILTPRRLSTVATSAGDRTTESGRGQMRSATVVPFTRGPYLAPPSPTPTPAAPRRSRRAFDRAAPPHRSR